MILQSGDTWTVDTIYFYHGTVVMSPETADCDVGVVETAAVPSTYPVEFALYGRYTPYCRLDHGSGQTSRATKSLRQPRTTNCGRRHRPQFVRGGASAVLRRKCCNGQVGM